MQNWQEDSKMGGGGVTRIGVKVVVCEERFKSKAV